MIHGANCSRQLCSNLPKISHKKAIAGCRSQAFRASYSINSPSQESRVIFSGIQPTGVPHLGNFLGALQQWRKLQDEAAPADRFFFSVVDLHAVTVRHDATQLRKWKRETLAALLAAGLKPDRCTIYFQSAVRIISQSLYASN